MPSRAMLETSAADGGRELGPYSVAGRAFVVETNDAEMATRLERLLVDLAEPGATPEVTVLGVRRWGPGWVSHRWELLRDGVVLEATVKDDYVGTFFLREVNHLAMTAAPSIVPAYGAAVCRDGRAIILAGLESCGKSTLALWLAAHGWEYVSDDVVLIEEAAGGIARVRPFWRPVAVDGSDVIAPYIGDRRPDAESLVPASVFGGLGGPAEVAGVVFLHRRERDDVGVRARHPAAAVRELSGHLASDGVDHRTAFLALVRLVERVPVLELDASDPSVADAVLRDLVAGGR